MKKCQIAGSECLKAVVPCIFSFHAWDLRIRHALPIHGDGHKKAKHEKQLAQISLRTQNITEQTEQ